MSAFSLTQEACPHAWDESVMTLPRVGFTVHRDECAYCCRTALHDNGVYVCMCCHTGLCASHIAKHLSLRPSHAMYVRVKEFPVKEKAEEIRDTNYIAAAEPVEYETAVCCASCMQEFSAVPELAVGAYIGIKNAPVPGAQDAAQADGGFIQLPQCPHLVCLEQEANPYPPSAPPTSEDKCCVEGCDIRTNNWMCLTCGAVGCPRKESGGNGHALQHFLNTGHQATVKLGTVTAQGGDFYCYSCDDSVSDVHMETHLKHFGIDIHTSKKTAKTLGEMEYDYSTQFDYSKMTEAGSDLTPLFGPGYTGIYNIGNSCYIASVLQCLMRLPEFSRTFYSDGTTPHQRNCTNDPYGCRACQMERVAAGLLSGDFSVPRDNTKENSITPRSFKKVFAQSHPEFSTGQQQDAHEYLQYLLDQLKRYVKPALSEEGIHPSDIFELVMEQRVECDQCHRVRYTREKDMCLSLPIPVQHTSPALTTTDAPAHPTTQDTAESQAAVLAAGQLRPHCSLDDCLQAAAKESEISCHCGSCGAPATYKSTTRLATYPDVLVVSLRRAYFDMQTLSTKKLDVYVNVPEEIDLQAYRGLGLQPGEVEMAPSTPRVSAARKTSAASAPVDEMALVTMISMGVDTDIAQYALQKTDMNVERAVDYVFSHPEIASEMAAEATGAAVGPAATIEAATDGTSAYQLAAMISHVGSAAKTGHYVCHVKNAATGKWALFNDEKVGESQQPPLSMASIYFFTRKVA